MQYQQRQVLSHDCGDHVSFVITTYTIQGSHGTITVDSASKILRIIYDNPEERHYDHIQRFDIAEYESCNGVMSDTDICLLGYWNKDGSYEPPVEEMRVLGIV